MQSFVNIIILQKEPATFTLGRRGELFGSLNDPKVLKHTTIDDQCFLICYVCNLPTPYYEYPEQATHLGGSNSEGEGSLV